MANDMTDDPEMPVDNEETTPTEEAVDPQSLCAKKFTDYLDAPLAADRESAAGAATVACLGYEEYQTKVRLRLCRLEDARAVSGEYRAIRNGISTTMAAHAGGVAVNAAVYEMINGDLTKSLDAVLKALKEVKTQMGKVNTLACKLERDCNDSCTVGERRLIDKTLGRGFFKRNANDLIKKVKGEKDDNGLITVKGVTHHADDLFDMGVKYAGIQASANVVSLKPMATRLEETAKGLATDVTYQITALDATLLAQQTELDAEVTTLSNGLYERHATTINATSLEALAAELTDIADHDCATLDYDDAVATLVANCQTVVTTFDATAACPPGGEDNKFNTQDAPSC